LQYSNHIFKVNRRFPVVLPLGIDIVDESSDALSPFLGIIEVGVYRPISDAFLAKAIQETWYEIVHTLKG
jgi:hypothetical protein